MSKTTRIVLLTSIDILLVAFSVLFSYLLRFDFHIPESFLKTLRYVIPLYVLLIIIGFNLFKIYKRIWQYASVGDLISIFKGVAIGTIAFFLIQQLIINYLYSELIVPRSIYLLTTIIAFFVVGGSRFLWRLTRDNYRKLQPDHRRALIVGAGEAGILVVKELKHSKSDYYPVAFIDDDLQKQNYEIVGVPVVGTRHDIVQAVEDYNIDDIIIAMPSASRVEISKILNICKETNKQIKIIPRVNDLIDGKVTVKMIRDVSVEDLLGREPVKVNMDEITGYLKDKVVLVTGAGGSIGSEISRQVAAVTPKELLLLGHGENSIYDIELELRRKYPDLSIHPIIADIQDQERILQVFQSFQPQVVFHAAAHKHVPLMEANPHEAIKNNVFGTQNVATAASQYGAERFVLISTDKAVNPTSVMGVTKRIAELIVQSLNGKSNTIFTAVRFGNVLGSRGSVIPVFKKQIELGGPVTVTHPDMVRYFMTIPEAVQLVIQAGAFAEGGEVFILDMGKPVKIADLARDLIKLSGLTPDKDIQVVYTGIRPGEKLFEEIMSKEEGATATKHDRIFVGRPLGQSAEKLHQLLVELQTLQDANAIRMKLKEIVPTYQIAGEDATDHHRAKELLQASLELVAAVERKCDE